MLALSVSAAPQIPSESSKTASDQKNNKEDLALTAKIRKALMDDKALSVAARNATIIVSDGMVTIRGAVKSQYEKELVAVKARDIAGAAMVTDLLTVSPPKAN